MEPFAAQLGRRIRKACDEGRFQNALDLARQLHKQEPSPESRQVLKEAMLGRAEQLRDKGSRRDAVVVYQNARQLDPLNPAWLEKVAEGLARCGELRAALDFLRQLPQGTEPAQLLGHIADAAIELDSAGRAQLPAALQADHDAIVHAFEQLEQAQDEAVRDTLQAIGLRSPFLEWKILLRGLLAYYQRDDARAIENWQRLDPHRLPARLAAPFRAAIDAAFRAAQPPALQSDLRQKYEHLQGLVATRQLRALNASMRQAESLANVFRQAESLLPALRHEAPDFVPRLANSLYWAIIDTTPDDVLRYRRVFGEPADDPHFNRLHALAYEKHDMLQESQKYWEKYEQDLATVGAHWPPAELTRARALVWLHMGEAAASLPSPAEQMRLRPFLRHHFGDMPKLKPTAEQCYCRAIDLDPDEAAAYDALYTVYLRTNKKAKAEKIARELLKRRPDHAPMLQALAQLLQDKGSTTESLELYERALRCHPLDRELKRAVHVARLLEARAKVMAGAFGEARPYYQGALEYAEPDDVPSVYFRWAAAEFKAGDANRAEELLEKARQSGGAPLFVSFGMMTEVARLGLHAALKKRFDSETSAGFKQPPCPHAAAQLIQYAALLHNVTPPYTGMATHLRKTIGYVRKAKDCAFSQREYEILCSALVLLDSSTLARTLARKAAQAYPDHPLFPLLEARALREPNRGPRGVWQIRPLLQRSRELAEALPHGHPHRQEWLSLITNELALLDQLDPFAQNVFQRIFDRFEDLDDSDS